MTKPLGDLFTTATGNTPPKNNAKFYGNFIPLVKPPELCDGQLDSAEDGLSKAGAEVARILPPNSILVSCIGNLGKIALNVVPVAFNQQINAILPETSKAVPEFMFYQVLSCGFKDQLEALASGTTVPIVNKSKFNSIQVVLPPLPEQHRIVGLLDEAFEGLATAKANAQKNLQNARALFESHLQSVFTQRGPGWVETTLGDAYDVRDGTHDSPKYHATGFPLITSKNLKMEGLSFDNIKLISEKDYHDINKRSAVHKGDVLFAMIGTIGNPTLVEVEPNFAIKNVALFKMQQGQSGAFLRHYLGSSLVIDKMMREAKGTTQKFVGLGYLRAFPIDLPPLPTQLKLVGELDSLHEETQRLARLYEQKLAALEALKKSLLHQAFSGEL